MTQNTKTVNEMTAEIDSLALWRYIQARKDG